ncbi:ATP-binding cassette bilirubin transporter bpt1 [Lodderomyces elongisporus]|uniref:ATP-binding cassette bilirubin transporter bpt1 n=1 Tax=Lodderomyces elongisporus TaxID=36914 RepID=UPI00292444BF|nr:ATP-binding cassette bilirubin transporter bpt1 [Lodderomyces elongisporus]WLF76933.1 ATP-binding cassette bilirubin transporter bpt1 [Lodderomyces elongisporus]
MDKNNSVLSGNPWSDHLITGFNSFQLSSLNPYSLLHTFNYLSVKDDIVVGVDSLFSVNANDLKSYIPDPLYSNHENAVNPQFAYFVGYLLNGFFAIFMAKSFVKLLFTNQKHNRIQTATPLTQTFKVFLIIIQIVVLITLFLLTKLHVTASLAAVTTLALILAMVEFRKSPIPVASSLLFWITNTFFIFGVFIQDTFSKHKIITSSSGAEYILEIFLLVNSLSIFILELAYYTPGFETDNVPFMEKTNLFSYITFYFLQPLINHIYETNDVKFEELPEILGDLSCDKSKAKVIKYWDEEKELAKSRKPSIFWKIWNRLKGKKTSKKRQDEKSKPNLFTAIFLAFLPQFFGNFALKVLETTLNFSQPFVLMKFIQFFTIYFYSLEKPPIIIGYFWAALMFTISCANFITFNQAFSLQYSMGYGIQSSLTTIIYEKALRLSPQSRKNKPTGDVINHITMDIDIIFWFCWSLGEFMAAPLRLGVCLVSLYKLFGNATWAGVLTAAIVTPIATKVNTSMSKYYIQEMKDKDDRTSLTTEILNSAKSIKFYSWEKPMLARLSHIRNDRELYNIKQCGIVSALAQFFWSCIPFFISCSTYAAYSYFYSVPLTPDIVFPALALFDLLSEPMLLIPNFIVDIIEVSTSMGRIGDLLCLDELADDQDGHVIRDPEARDNSEVSVIIKDSTFIWNNSLDADDKSQFKDEESEVQEDNSSTTNNIALKDINFIAKKSKLTCIVGKVGSGKSTLIRAILGDIPIDIPQYSDNPENSQPQPSVKTYGSIAYCPQAPWILNGTVKENILFGHKYDSEFYRKTIIACELVSDFKTLPDGDQTVVGEKGISLSGGQKARISLARAVYARADIYLLDDVLSAVDAHVGKALIKQVLSDDGIIGDRTKILATNSVPVLHEANDIYLLVDGKIAEHGNYAKVMKADGDLAALIKEYGRKKDDGKASETAIDIDGVPIKTNKLALSPDKSVDPAEALNTQDLVDEIVDYMGEENRGVVRQSILRRASLVSYNHTYENDVDDNEEEGGDGDGGGQVPVVRKTGHTEEESRKGTVPWDIFKQYIVACNYKYFSFYVIGTLLTLLITVAEKYLLSYWSGINRDENKTVNPVFFLSVYALLGVVAGLLTYLAALVIWGYCIVKGSAYFHDKMAQSVLRSPMSFFDTTPVGRILNRFTEDIGRLDMNFPWMLIGFVTAALNALVTFGVIFISLPAMFFVILGLLVVYNYFRTRFVPAARELKRLESVAKSPVLATIQESINGVDTIKAFHQRDRFVHKSKKFVDDKTLIGVVTQNCNRWLSMRLQFISSSIMFATALLAVVTLGGKHPILPSVLGFVMTYSLSVMYILNAIVRYWADMQSGGVAIERIIEYCNLPSEAPMIIEGKRPDDKWPANGIVKFKKYSTAYRANLDPVLKEIELTIDAKEKVGIVGRTGAGKSSLTLALFRIIEATGGYIEIDGVNVNEIGLYDLRHHLTIIPQEAHTFRASVRENLDPFGEYTDEKLWKVLELAHLKEHVESMETDPTKDEKEKSEDPDELPKKRGLDAHIEEGGANLSAGQKQLLCLARALLNETSKILVLDEATAAVDFQTDKIIQETIREQFKDKTILTIAHRIDTIMDSDKILVLDKGEVAEFDTPQNLLKDKQSIFYSLASEGGYLN